MTLEAVRPEELKKVVRTRKKPISKLIMDFWQSDLEAVRVDFGEDEYKNVYSAQACFSKSAKNLRVGVRAMAKQGKLYLIKEKFDK